MGRRLFALLLILAATLMVIGGCGGKSDAITEDQYNRIEKGMTLDEVEAIAGSPERTHKLGTASDPNIIWYYVKADSDGLVRISFLGGKVDTLTPYNVDVSPEE